jgi:hypothetical protein
MFGSGFTFFFPDKHDCGCQHGDDRTVVSSSVTPTCSTPNTRIRHIMAVSPADRIGRTCTRWVRK